MVIRKATAEDIDVLIELRLLYLAEHFGDILKTEQQISGQLAGYFAAHLSRDFEAFLAEEHNRPIACAFLVVQEKPANPRFPGGKTGLVLNVYTRSEYRRRGTAGSLLSALIKEAESLGLSYIELTSTEAGEPLYKSFGFEQKDTNQEMILVLNKR